MNAQVRPYPWGLWLIGGFKLVSGLLLVALAIGLFRHVDADPVETVEHLLAVLKLDPDNAYIHGIIAKISGVNPKQLRAISFGTFLYAAMYLTEATGLLLRKRWGEYFTVLATGFFIPLEIFEVWRKITTLRMGVLLINVAIVIYLIIQVVKNGRDKANAKQTSAPSSDSGSIT